MKLFVALGWEDDEKSNGYAAAKDKVAKRVPAQDWSCVSQEGCPEKSQETPSQGGRPKQLVAISANGMKHLLAHVPNQDLAGGTSRGWVVGGRIWGAWQSTRRLAPGGPVPPLPPCAASGARDGTP